MVSMTLLSFLALAAFTTAAPLAGTATADIDISAAIEAHAAEFSLLSRSLSARSSSSDVTDNATCKEATLIFARGTSETGNMGSVVGPTLQSKLEDDLGGADKLNTQGVDYSADISGAITGSISPKSASGAQEMATLTKDALSQCADTKIVLSGYSQGAQMVHGALMNLEDAQLNKVAAVVTFGDPLSSSSFEGVNSSITKVYCNSGDLVCDNTFIITINHLTYGSTSAAKAATFISDLIQ